MREGLPYARREPLNVFPVQLSAAFGLTFISAGADILIGEAFLFRALERGLFDQNSLPLVAFAGAAPFQDNAKSNKPASGAAAIMLGLLTLTIQYTMGSIHTWGGVNYADVFHASMTGIGIGLLFGKRGLSSV